MNNFPFRRFAQIAATVIALQVAYVFFFVFPGHEPKPNGLKLGIVGTEAQAGQARKQIETVLPGATGVRLQSRSQARQAIEDREIYGAFVSGPSGEQVLTAPPASVAVSSSLTLGALTARARPVEVLKLGDGDPRGVVFNLLTIPLVVTGLLGAQLAVLLLKGGMVRHRFLIVAGVAILSGLAVATLVGPVLGALPGAAPLLAGVIALAIFGLLTVGGGLIRLLGPAGLGIGFAIFLMIGSPASGAATAPELLPTPWAEVGQVLTPGALVSALRSIAYFDGAGIVFPVAALTAVALVGVALELLADRRAPVPASAPAPAAPAVVAA